MRSNFWDNRRVFVVGGGGYLGIELVRALAQYGARVTVFDRADCRPAFAGFPGAPVAVKVGDLLRGDLAASLAEVQPETCFHLAGLPGVAASQADPGAAFEANARGVWLFLLAAKVQPGIREIVLASSNHVYGEQEILPTGEDSPLRGASTYAVSKICGDYAARAFVQYGLPIALARITNTFGAVDPHSEHIISSTIRAVLAGRRPVIRGNGKDSKGFLYYKDTINAFLTLAEELQAKRLFGEAFNFAPDSPITVLELTRVIARVLGRPDLEPAIQGDPNGPFEREYLSIEKARRVLGWSPSWRLEDAVREAAAASGPAH
ncbi:NAD-dependent epimerase/dehydratase family protein [Patescibacteria group bacterium]|nr:MAG: NAD-dependent epimerase/dehydratase family protein [Patescibacteria group bacterium]